MKTSSIRLVSLALALAGTFFVLACDGTPEPGGAGETATRALDKPPIASPFGPGDTFFCGGIAGIQCPDGLVCIDDPSDSCSPACGGADCGGICVELPAPPFCGGIAGFQCPAGSQCVDAKGDQCSPLCGGADCGGMCVTPTSANIACGGFAGIQCPDGMVCIDDPGDKCDPDCGGADCGGVCVWPAKIFCGGIAGFQCPDGMTCIDDPTDSCDPACGGADCGGMCVTLPVTETYCATNADCGDPSGLVNADSVQYCKKDTCDGKGVCADRPQICTDEWAPVCGCDGATYGNACEAAAAGQNVAHDGECSTACKTNADCASGFCAKDLGACGDAGTCEPLPVGCPKNLDPVCGCDGEEYPNACYANLAGQNVAIDGPCPRRCRSNRHCRRAEFCSKDLGDCLGTGMCRPRPRGCPKVLDPVCGCNGHTYANKCFAARAGATIAYPGECKKRCKDSKHCEKGEYCAKEAGDCDGAGVCEPIPQICPLHYAPVCGCDGNDYSSPCFAAMESMNVASVGDCPDACYETVDATDPYHDRFEGIGFNNACAADADCTVGGCSGEVCAAETVYTTCELLPYGPSGSCGCLDGQCVWNECGGCGGTVDAGDPYHDRFEGIGFVNDCKSDADCTVGGCSGEVCAAEPVFTTCEALPYGPAGGCGCVDGQCIWNDCE